MGAKNTFKSLEDEIQEIANKYFLKKKIIKENPSLKKKNQNYIDKIGFVYQLLNSEEKIIINNEFFLQDYPEWWKRKYSLEDFQIHKYFAMTHFLEVYKYVHD